MKVLIVDDEQDTLEFLSYNLRQANFSVIDFEWIIDLFMWQN
jgi:DNA-binding response OmpR family regulator